MKIPSRARRTQSAEDAGSPAKNGTRELSPEQMVKFKSNLAKMRSEDLDAMLGPRQEPALGDNLLKAARNGSLFEALSKGEADPLFGAVETILAAKTLRRTGSEFSEYLADFKWLLDWLNGRDEKVDFITEHIEIEKRVASFLKDANPEEVKLMDPNPEEKKLMDGNPKEARHGEPIAYVEAAIGIRENPNLGYAVAAMLGPKAEVTREQEDIFGAFLLGFAYHVGRLSERMIGASKGRLKQAIERDAQFFKAAKSFFSDPRNKGKKLTAKGLERYMPDRMNTDGSKAFANLVSISKVLKKFPGKA